MTKLQLVFTNAQDVATRKKQLRAYMKKRRSENENRDVKMQLLTERFFQVTARLFSGEDEGEKKRKYFVYLSFSSEAGTDLLIEELQKRGAEVYCPRIEQGEMKAVRYQEDFTLSALGIREPVGEAYEGEMDVIVTPALAVDKRGNRLGYGGGYYDRYFQAHENAKRIGFCFDFQLLQSVPTEETDKPLDIVVTDKQTIWIQTDKE